MSIRIHRLFEQPSYSASVRGEDRFVSHFDRYHDCPVQRWGSYIRTDNKAPIHRFVRHIPSFSANTTDLQSIPPVNLCIHTVDIPMESALLYGSSPDAIVDRFFQCILPNQAIRLIRDASSIEYVDLVGAIKEIDHIRPGGRFCCHLNRAAAFVALHSRRGMGNFAIINSTLLDYVRNFLHPYWYRYDEISRTGVFLPNERRNLPFDVHDDIGIDTSRPAVIVGYKGGNYDSGFVCALAQNPIMIDGRWDVARARWGFTTIQPEWYFRSLVQIH